MPPTVRSGVLIAGRTASPSGHGYGGSFARFHHAVHTIFAQPAPRAASVGLLPKYSPGVFFFLTPAQAPEEEKSSASWTCGAAAFVPAVTIGVGRRFTIHHRFYPAPD